MTQKKKVIEQPTKATAMTKNERIAQTMLQRTEQIEKAAQRTHSAFVTTVIATAIFWLLAGLFVSWLLSATLAPWLSLFILLVVTPALEVFAVRSMIEDRRTGQKWAMKKRVTSLEHELGYASEGAHACIYCDHPLGKGDAFCINCGRRQEAIIGRRCEKGHVTPLHGQFCRTCGIALTGKPTYVYDGDAQRPVEDRSGYRLKIQDGPTA